MSGGIYGQVGTVGGYIGTNVDGDVVAGVSQTYVGPDAIGYYWSYDLVNLSVIADPTRWSLDVFSWSMFDPSLQVSVGVPTGIPSPVTGSITFSPDTNQATVQVGTGVTDLLEAGVYHTVPPIDLPNFDPTYRFDPATPLSGFEPDGIGGFDLNDPVYHLPNYTDRYTGWGLDSPSEGHTNRPPSSAPPAADPRAPDRSSNPGGQGGQRGGSEAGGNNNAGGSANAGGSTGQGSGNGASGHQSSPGNSGNHPSTGGGIGASGSASAGTGAGGTGSGHVSVGSGERSSPSSC